MFNNLLIHQTDSLVKNAKISTTHFILSIFGLLLCGLAIELYQIEAALKLPLLFSVTVISFLIHALLPFRYKEFFLFLANLVAIVILFGFTSGLIIIFGALTLFAILILPIKHSYRVILTALVTFFLAGIVTNWIPIDQIYTPAKIIGSLFMFRAILFLYESKHEKNPLPLMTQLNYFFLLPNLIFAIFPVVDYRSFGKKYYSVPAHQNYFKGLHWIMRGLVHLMIYRLVYYYLVPNPKDINSLFTLIQYIVSSYVLIIRLSGIFHLSAGLICLFGYNLPPTFDNYFLASSFSDIWRRINIYWKDFIMKVFYYPILFKFKKRNDWAVFFTILIVFFINWLLHQYQWFWIRGNFPIRLIDFIFWLGFGLLIALNSIYQRRNKTKRPATIGFDKAHAFIKSLKTIGMFTFMCLFWSFWTSNSIPDWFLLLNQGNVHSLEQVLIFLFSIIALSTLGTVLFYIDYLIKQRKQSITPYLFLKSYTFSLFIFVCLAFPPATSFIEQKFSFDAGPVLEMRLNEFDEDQLFQGYYENLLVGNNFSSRMWEIKNKKAGKKPDLVVLGDFDILEVNFGHPIQKKLIANKSITFKNKPFSTNEFGMRDRSYSLQKEPSTLRIALLGGSNEMGSGVGDQETFENLLEDRLNSIDNWLGYEKIEILNFAISGIYLLSQVGIVEQEILAFDPDAIMYCVHSGESTRGNIGFAPFMKNNSLDRYPVLKKIYEDAQFGPSSSVRDIRVSLDQYHVELTEWGLNRISIVCKENNITPICVFTPTLAKEKQRIKKEFYHNDYLDLFSNYGFSILDLYGIFNTYNLSLLRIAKYDKHYNSKAHQLISDKLFIEIGKNHQLQNRLKNDE